MTDEERDARALVNRTVRSAGGDKDKALLALARQVTLIRTVSLKLSPRHEDQLRKTNELLEEHNARSRNPST